MSTNSRHCFSWLFSLLAALVTLATPAPSWADNYPNRAISIVTPVAPGSPFDLLARLFADRLSRKIKQSVVVENVTGGQAMLATKKVLNAPADGYTLFLTPGGLATTPVILKDAGYTLDDFTPIAPVGQAPYILFVSASVKATDIPSFMKEVKERGKSMNHGVLTTSQLSVVLSKKIAASAGGEPYEEIGYKGSPEMIRALLADDVAGDSAHPKHTTHKHTPGLPTRSAPRMQSPQAYTNKRQQRKTTVPRGALAAVVQLLQRHLDRDVGIRALPTAAATATEQHVCTWTTGNTHT